MKCIGATSWHTNRKPIGCPCHALHYIALRQPSCSNQLVCQSPAILYTTGSAMVSIKEAKIQHQEEKPVLIPHSLILNHEGQKYLKVRPTSQPIICLLHGKQSKRNASLSQLEPLGPLIEARNQEIKKVHCEDPVTMAIVCLTSRKQILQPRNKGLLHHHHVWWPSLLVTNLWIAWYLARGQPDLTLQFCWSQTTWTQWFATWGQALPLLWCSPPNPTRPRSEAACILRKFCLWGDGKKSCSQRLNGYPYMPSNIQFAASIGEAFSLQFMFQSQASGFPWKETYAYFSHINFLHGWFIYAQGHASQFVLPLSCNCHGCSVPASGWRGPSHHGWYRWHLP